MSTSTIMVIILAVLTALVVGTFLWVYIRDKTIDEIRVDVYHLFLKAEHAFKESGSGKQKMKYVVSQARKLLPSWLQYFVTDEFLESVIEKWFQAVKDLLDDGKLLAQVDTAEPDALVCTVVRGGVLQSRKSLAAPGADIQMPTLTAEDKENLAIAADCGVTGVMLPFVRGAADIRNLRQALAEAGAPQLKILAKIENLAGVQALPEFLPLVDEVVIARGDLGNAMPLWELPRCQKQLSAACRAAGVPFMVVTQMLDSMHTRAVPTRAEVSDIYNAVLDGASSLMLTGETAAGQYPVQAMEYLVRTARTAM